MAELTLEPKIFACSQSKDLAEKIAESFGTKLGNVIRSTYSDGEFQPSFEESVRGRRVFFNRLYTSYVRKFNGIVNDA
jgi:ribose-phosphate pyrophosphokinase